MGAYRWQEVEAATYQARNVKKYGDTKRKSGVRTQQAKFFDAGETSEARYARLKREEKEAKAKAFLEMEKEGAWSHYDELAAKDGGKGNAEEDAEDAKDPGENKEGDAEAVAAAAVQPAGEDKKGKEPEV